MKTKSKRAPRSARARKARPRVAEPKREADLSQLPTDEHLERVSNLRAVADHLSGHLRLFRTAVFASPVTINAEQARAQLDSIIEQARAGGVLLSGN